MKASLKRWVLRACLNVGRVLACLMWLGRAFQRDGAAAEKAPSPQVRSLVLVVLRVVWSSDLRQREGVWRGTRSAR